MRIIVRICHATSSHRTLFSPSRLCRRNLQIFFRAQKSTRPGRSSVTPRARHTRGTCPTCCAPRALSPSRHRRDGGGPRGASRLPRASPAPPRRPRGALGNIFEAHLATKPSWSRATSPRAKPPRRAPALTVASRARPPRRVPARAVASGARPSRARPNHRSRARCSVAFVRRSSHSPWGSLSRSPTRRPRWPGFRENRKVSPFTAPRRRCP